MEWNVRIADTRVVRKNSIALIDADLQLFGTTQERRSKEYLIIRHYIYPLYPIPSI
jgi:hypothetical protein